MWKKLFSNIFSGSRGASRTVNKRQGVPTFSSQMPRQSVGTPPLDQLWSKVSPLSSTDHRFLHPRYSPSSRVPCADFTRFIVDRLKNQDIDSIRQLMRAIISGNPGFGIGPGWIDEKVNEIASIDFGRYCWCSNSDFALELKALFILSSKDGGQREFWLADEQPLLFAFALCCHDIQWLDGVEQLIERANFFIRKMRKDTPFWETYPLFDRSGIASYSINSPIVASLLMTLPLLSRIHLVSFAERGAASLPQSTNYKMRSLGINPLETAPILLKSGICEPASSVEVLVELFSKEDLIAALAERNITYRKSWKKGQLIEALNFHAPDFIVQAAEREGIARVKPEFLSELRLLSANAQMLQERIKLLCFATPETQHSGHAG